MAESKTRQRAGKVARTRRFIRDGVRLLTWLVLVGSSAGWASEDPLCSFTMGDAEASLSTKSVVQLRSIFLTFPNAVEVSGDSLLPGYANEMTQEFTEFLSWISRGNHEVNFEVVKRPGADSTFAWVMPRPSGRYPGFSLIRQELEEMLPHGWDEGVDLPIYFFAAKPACCGNMGLSQGRLSELDNYIFIRYGDVIGSGYVLQSPWLVKGLLVHEYGHQLGAGHLPDGTSGEFGWCSGGYWSCYGAMDRGIFTGCDRWKGLNGYVPYHVKNLIRFGWIFPRVLRRSEAGVKLRDVRRTGEVLKIPVAGTFDQEYFLIENHQMSENDRILNGRGLLVWHIREEPGEYRCSARSGTAMTIMDLEHQAGMWRVEFGSDVAPLWPHKPDPIGGRDTLDYRPGMLPSAFYSGLSLGGSPLRESKGFGPDTNPSSFMYKGIATTRRDLQVAPSGVTLRCIEAIPDPDSPGNYVMKFDVAIY